MLSLGKDLGRSEKVMPLRKDEWKEKGTFQRAQAGCSVYSCTLVVCASPIEDINY